MDLNPGSRLDAATVVNKDDPDRRDLVRKLGKFAVYAAPFTVLAMTSSAASGSGGGSKPKSTH